LRYVLQCFFAVIFVVLSVATGFVKTTLGDSGLMVLAGVVGISDITPFVLSLIQGSEGPTAIFTSAIMMALMSNTIAKAVYFGSLSRSNRKQAAWKYSLVALYIFHLLSGNVHEASSPCPMAQRYV